MELRFTQRHVIALNLLLIAGVVYFAVRCIDDIVLRRMSTDSAAPIEAATAPNSSGVQTRIYYDTIVKRDVFNLAPQDNGPAPVVVEDLHLKLLGTSLLSKSQPYAIVEDPAGNESLYQVGEDIPDAGKLVGVEVNRAIIDHGGQRVALEIPTAEMQEATPSQLGGLNTGHIPAVVQRRGANRRFRGG